MEISFAVPQMASPRFDLIAEENAEAEWDRLRSGMGFAGNAAMFEDESDEEEEWGEEVDDREEETPRFVSEMEQWVGETPATPLSSTPRFNQAMLKAGVFQVDEDSATEQFYDTDELSGSTEELVDSSSDDE